jgi:hypothetical protein
MNFCNAKLPFIYLVPKYMYLFISYRHLYFPTYYKNNILKNN